MTKKRQNTTKETQARDWEGFSNTFNTIQPELKVKKMQMESALISWMMDYPTCRKRPEQYRGPTRDCPVPFPRSTACLTSKLTQAAVFFRNFLIIQLVVGCIQGCAIWAAHYWGLFGLVHLQSSTAQHFQNKGKGGGEARTRSSHLGIRVGTSYRYLGIQLDNKLYWTSPMGALNKREISRRSFNICKTLLCTSPHQFLWCSAHT